jgi:hypothetical protein
VAFVLRRFFMATLFAFLLCYVLNFMISIAFYLKPILFRALLFGAHGLQLGPLLSDGISQVGCPLTRGSN